ncbi:T9SS type A sorting domain-containing protein [Hymenobacter bucti]|uniref:T9SS type A sorting domain-containing protein n=1 Tax=Hymenobacter bucti TaxID=1844114 RepID=A0ABW4QW47_9BACT
MKKVLFFSSLLLSACTAVSAQSIAGTVFEDVNYGGGAGRSMQTANAVLAGSAVALSAPATVELYNGNNSAYLRSTTTNTTGNYSFTGLANNTNYIVRVVNNTVRSTRPGTVAGLLPVQTFVVSNGVGDVNRVGGEAPDRADVGTNTTAKISAIIAQSQARVMTAGAVTGVDFGFNFDVITNDNDSGQGSLRQFLLNANALTGNAALRQVGQAPRRETSLFMISDGLAHPGLRVGLVKQLTGATNSTLALLNLSAVLATVTDAATVLDGTTQTENVGNTNTALLGTGGAVGTSDLALDKINGPEVELSMPRNTATTAVMLTLSGDSSAVRGLAAHGSYTNVQLGGKGFLLEGNTLGINATAVAIPSTTATGNTILVLSAPTGTVRNNLIGYAGNSGLNYSAGAGTTGVAILDNEFLQNGQLVAGGDNITVGDNGVSGPLLIEGNLIALGNSSGIQLEIGSVSDNIIRNNTITANGTSGFATRLEGSGIHYLARTNSVNSTNTDLITLNVIAKNQSSGVVINYGQKKVRVSQNSIYENGNGTTGGQGLLSIDFTGPNGYVGGDVNYGQGDGVTANDGLLNILGTLLTSIPPYRQGDGGIDYPIITSITKLPGTNTIQVKGYVGTLLSLGKFAGATVEIYSANNADTNQDGPTFLGDALTVAHGEAQYYIGSVTVGATGNFDGLITNPAHAISVGDNITATAYLPEFGTSECGINKVSTFAVVPLPVVLTSFSAVARGADAALSWATASEANNAYFSVERSFDGQQFASIGRVAGQGSTTATHTYSFLDAQPLPAGGTSYYRLRQVDTDGTGTYSPVRTVALAGPAASPALYPSPATTATVTLDLTTVPLGDYTVTLHDLAGRQLRSLVMPGGQAHPLVLDQPAGVYLLTVRGLGKTFTQRVVKE